MSDINLADIPVGVDLSTDNIERVQNRASEASSAFARKVDKLQATIIEAAERFRGERQSMIDSALPEDRKSIRTAVERDVDKQTNALRRQLVDSSDSERGEILLALSTLENEAGLIGELCASPAMLLGRHALGDPKRTQFMQQLTGAGPVELITAARLAISTDDKVLAAAVMTVLDRRPRKDRPFSVAELAEKVLGEEFKSIQAQLGSVREAAKAARVLDREFQRGKSDPTAKIALGLAKHNARGK